MNAPLPQRFTNEISPEFLRTLDKSPFTDQQIVEFREEAIAAIRQNQVYLQAHPPCAIYRFASAGSRTRDGGEIQQATSPMEIILDNGQQVCVAQVGDYVVYDDGRKAQIVTGAGFEYEHLALVGSLLSNGDEIIDTLQGLALIAVRDGVPMADDFLPVVEG
ncbi:PAAR domain-containing protein [Pseudomonas akapageensis]|uniref:PAAR domain-containing protein n=1 Tax=Pseudomonas akapageensis TaxID=2609961 RepID=UPI001407440A|nr:PAAR domain-containing protein [Pseudomonas akapageensis]